MTTNNRVRASTFDGVDLDLTNNATVTDNFTELNGGPGIGLYDGATGNTLANNQIERNSNNVSSATDIGGGILLDDASNNILRSNHIRKNGTLNGFDNTDGIRLNFPSTGNSIQGNRLRDNVTHDCHDASTGNTWVDNRGETSSPPGLCGEDREDDYTAEAGWDPAYPWYAAFDVAPDYDWATAYATIDTNSLLQLLPQIRLGGIRRATVSPDQ